MNSLNSSSTHISLLVGNKGRVRESSKELFIQELKALLSYRKHSDTERDHEQVDTPRINHRKFNEFSQMARKTTEKVKISHFGKKHKRAKYKVNRLSKSASVKQTLRLPLR